LPRLWSEEKQTFKRDSSIIWTGLWLLKFCVGVFLEPNDVLNASQSLMFSFDAIECLLLALGKLKTQTTNLFEASNI